MESIDRERFGNFLSELRKEKGFTQRELAEKLFVSDKAVSKWERGQSLPDISLLTPLSQLLGVSVAELLKGERLTGETLSNCEAESLVDKAVHLSAEEQEKRRKDRLSRWRLWVICAFLAGAEVLLITGLCQMAGAELAAVELWDFLLLVEILSLLIGGYFCFFAKETLPAYYDENKISAYSDGIFRMNLPGVFFNNSNWPHIVRVGRLWPLGTAVLWPLVFGICRTFLSFFPMLWLTLLFCLSFFIPMMVVAKKYQ